MTKYIFKNLPKLRYIALTVVSATLLSFQSLPASGGQITYEQISSGSQSEMDMVKLIKKHIVKSDSGKQYIYNDVQSVSDREFSMAVEKLDKRGEVYNGR